MNTAVSTRAAPDNALKRSRVGQALQGARGYASEAHPLMLP
jgi:hypothetical protein